MLDEHKQEQEQEEARGDYGGLFDGFGFREKTLARPSLSMARANRQNRSADELPDADVTMRANPRSISKPIQTPLPTSATASNLHRQAVSIGDMLPQQSRLAPKSLLANSATSMDIMEELACDFSTSGLSRSTTATNVPHSAGRIPTKPTPKQPQLQNPYYALHVGLEQAMVQMHEAIAAASALFDKMLYEDGSILAKLSQHAKTNPKHRLNQICQGLGHIASLLGNGRPGWRLTDMTDDFFQATLPVIQKVEAALWRLIHMPCFYWLREKAYEEASTITHRLRRVQEQRRDLLQEMEDDLFEQEIVEALEEEHGDRDGDLGMDGAMGWGSQTAPAPAPSHGIGYHHATVEEDDEMDVDLL